MKSGILRTLVVRLFLHGARLDAWQDADSAKAKAVEIP